MNFKIRSRMFRIVLLSLFFIGMGGGKAYGQFYSVKLDVLGAATGTLSVEGSMALNTRWSLHLPIMYNPWTFSSNKKLKHLTMAPGARVWVIESYGRGLFFGMNAIASWYNYGGMFGSDYRREGIAAGMGLSVGYSLPIAKRWNLEFELGGGAVWTKYDKFLCITCGEKLEKGTTGIRFVPNKVQVGIVYIF